MDNRDLNRAYLGVSFRWRPEKPDEGVSFDSFGHAQTALYVTNHGRTPARDVTFHGVLAIVEGEITEAECAALLASDPGELANLAPRNCNSAAGGGLPLYYVFGNEEEAVAGRDDDLHAIGRITYRCVDDAPTDDPRELLFCCRWDGQLWRPAAVHNTAT